MDAGRMNRPLLAAAGLCGAAGVALAAAGGHGLDATLETGAMILLLHAAALVGISILDTRLARVAGWLIAAGAAAFSGEIALHVLLGVTALGLLAPIGGLLLIAGWLVLAASAVARRT